MSLPVARFPLHTHLAATLLALLGLVGAGCTVASLDRSIERKVARVADSEKTTTIPAQEIPLHRVAYTGEVPVRLDAEAALTLAQNHSRSLQTRREELARAALTLFATRRDFEPRLEGAARFVVASIDDSETETSSTELSASQRLPTGGRLEVGGTWEDAGGDEDTGDRTTARARFEQPLTRGAGFESGWEALTQARRDFVYALRDFSLDRQDAAIDTLRALYNLVQQQSVVANNRENLKQFVFLRERSEALFRVDRAPAIDVLRSQQQELTALNRLNEVEERFGIGIGRFLIDLGLPYDLEVDLAENPPPLREVNLAEDEAVDLALDRRFEVMTARDRVADAERRLRIARQNRLPELDIFGEGRLREGEDGDTVEELQAGASLELPLDLRPERDAVKQAALDLAAARRAYDEQRDRVRLDVREAFSRLRTQRTSVDIQLRNMEIAERRVGNAMLQFRNGTLSNRDVIEAQNELLNARNAWGQALVDYEVQRLLLLRNVGLMDIDPNGGIRVAERHEETP